MVFKVGKDGPPGRGGGMTANQRESEEDPSGFVFKNSSLTGDGIAKCTLGRGYRRYSRVIIANSFLGEVVSPVGWDAWNGKDHE